MSCTVAELNRIGIRICIDHFLGTKFGLHRGSDEQNANIGAIVFAPNVESKNG